MTGSLGRRSAENLRRGRPWSTLRAGEARAAAVAPVDALADGARVVVLVEGVSDQVAVETLAARRDVDLGALGVAVVPMGGASATSSFAEMFGPHGRGLRLVGLYDIAQEPIVRSGLVRAGVIDADLGRLSDAGFHACRADLEDELIRALGVPAVEAVIDAAGERASYLAFLRQPAQRERPAEQRLRRFLGARSGGKVAYAAALVAAADGDGARSVPAPLEHLLRDIVGG